MAQTIKLKRSATAGNTPTTSQLELGELGINTTDGKLFLKKSVSGTESVVDVGDTSGYLPLSGGTLTGNLSLGDNVKAQFGGSNDLQIYHDGTHSYISDVGTGNLIIKGTHLNLRDANNTLYMEALQGGAVTLRHAGNISVATTSTGIDVTGSVVADGLTVQTTNGLNAVLESANSYQYLQFKNSQATTNYLGFVGQDFTVTGNNVKHLQVNGNGDISFYNTAGTSQNLFWDSSTSRLGLGTTVPSNIIHASGSGNQGIRIQSTGGGVPYFQLSTTGVGDQFIYGNVGSSQNIMFAVAGAERLKINADGSSVFSGSVGIMTDTPDVFSVGGTYRYLAVGGDKSGILNLVDNSTNGSYLQFGTAAGLRRASIHAVDGSHLAFTVNATNSGTSLTEAMRISSSRNVNIPNGSLMVGATTAPTDKLEIRGNAKIEQTSNVDAILRLNPNSGTIGSNYRWELVGGNSAASYGFQIREGTTPYLTINNSAGGNAGAATFSGAVSSTGLTSQLNGNGGLPVSSGTSQTYGSLRVGATSFATILDMGTAGATGAWLQASDKTALGTNYSLLLNPNGGFVGIGTNLPSYPLDVSGAAGDVVRFTGDANNSMRAYLGSGYQIFQCVNSGTTNQFGYGGGNFYVQTSGAERFRISADGSCRWTPDGTTHDMTLTADGNLLVGKTSQNLATEGISINPLGYIQVTESQSPTLYLNRLGTDGSIINFYKDTTTAVGNIGTLNSDLTIGSGDTGLRFNSANDFILPFNTTTNASRDAAIDLGLSTTRFKDLWLSGKVTAANIYNAAGGHVIDLNNTDSTIINDPDNHSCLLLSGGSYDTNYYSNDTHYFRGRDVLDIHAIIDTSGIKSLGDYKVGSTTVIDASRNLTNIDTATIGAASEANMGKLHIKSGDSGATPYQNGNSGIVVETSGRAAINLLTPNTQDSYVFFADPQSANAGYIGYEHSNNTLVLKSETYVKTSGSGLNVSAGVLQMSGTTVIDASRKLINVTPDATTAEYGISMVGNFGQWQAHSAYASGFNIEPAYWGWNFVQGNGNAPNTSSDQWYRNRVSLGDNYGYGTSTGDYWCEMAYPRYNQSTAGHMWMRGCENGVVGSWSQVGSSITGNITSTGSSFSLGTTTVRLINGPFVNGNVGLEANSTSYGCYMQGGTTNYAYFNNTKTVLNRRMEILASTSQGSTTPNIKSQAQGSGDGVTQYHINFTDSTGSVDGRITSNSFATTYGTTSDYRVKEDERPMSAATPILLALRPINFQWKGSDLRTDGFFAHEVAELVPDAVVGEKDATEEVTDDEGVTTTVDSLQALDQAKLVPLLVKTIQELEARITALESA